MSNGLLASPSQNIIDPALYDESPGSSKEKRKSVASRSDSKGLTPSNFTGWTPLVSKTISNEQLLAYNTTPSTKLLTGLLNGNPQSGHVVGQADFDYANGFNLTPFLNHNINFLGHNSGASGFTPFHDKSIHLTDFFIESPIRQSPIKDLETITPSKFRLQGELKRASIFQDPKSATKRPITLLDTPARQPHKLSITTRAKENDDGEDTEPERDEENENHASKKNDFQTPSKPALTDITNNYDSRVTPSRARPLADNHKFHTPAKPIQMSSPSTVIMSSSTKSPTNEAKRMTPASPTPSKSHDTKIADYKPVMGVFNEKSRQKPRAAHRDSKPVTTNRAEGQTRFKPSNKVQMEAGMNKFQILLEGSQKRGRRAASGSKKNSGSEKHKKKQEAPRAPTQAPPVVSQPPPPPQIKMSLSPSNNGFPPTFGFSGSHEVHANTSTKEISVISGHNNSMNTSHLNLTSNTDHSSFELGGISSTPNGKFSLEKFFEKPSPQSQQLLNQIFIQQQGYSNMPPPPPHNAKGMQQHNAQPGSMMMMSTPQHQSVYSPNLYHHAENSPDTSIPGFSYANVRKDLATSGKDKDTRN